MNKINFKKTSDVLNILCNNSLSINDIIKLLNNIDANQMPYIHKKLVSYDLYKLLSIKANIEKVAKVNFLFDQVNVKIKGLSFIFNSVTKNTIIFMIGTFTPFLIFLFKEITFTSQNNVSFPKVDISALFYKLLLLPFGLNLLVFFILLVVLLIPIIFEKITIFILIISFYLLLLSLLGLYTFEEVKLNNKKTTNKYKILLYLVDIAIEKNTTTDIYPKDLT